MENKKRIFTNIEHINEDERNMYDKLARKHGFRSKTELFKESVKAYDKGNDIIMDSLREIERFSFKVIHILQDEEKRTADETEALKLCALINELIPRVQLMVKDEMNYVFDPDPESKEQKVYKYTYVESKLCDSIMKSVNEMEGDIFRFL